MITISSTNLLVLMVKTVITKLSAKCQRARLHRFWRGDADHCRSAPSTRGCKPREKVSFLAGSMCKIYNSKETKTKQQKTLGLISVVRGNYSRKRGKLHYRAFLWLSFNNFKVFSRVRGWGGDMINNSGHQVDR